MAARRRRERSSAIECNRPQRRQREIVRLHRRGGHWAWLPVWVNRVDFAVPAAGPRTICYNRFIRWRRVGVWDQIMEALAAAHDAAVQMIDISVVRLLQHGACIAGNSEQNMGRSRGG